MNNALRLAQQIESGWVICTSTGTLLDLSEAYLVDLAGYTKDQVEEMVELSDNERIYFALKEGICLSDALDPELDEPSNEF